MKPYPPGWGCDPFAAVPHYHTLLSLCGAIPAGFGFDKWLPVRNRDKYLTNSKQETYDIVDKLTDGRVLSPSGSSWLRVALDPYHDFDVADVRGFPDTNTSKVLVETVNQSITISAPSGIGTGTWDLHIASLPEALATTEASFLAYTPSSNLLTQAATLPNGGDLHFLTCQSVTAGSPTFQSAAIPSVAYQGLDPPTALASGYRRLIACGFEVHDVTPELYRGGTMTVYRLPQANVINEFAASANSGGTFPVNTNYVTSTCPPNSIAQALSYTGSRQWEVPKGAYVPLTMDTNRQMLASNTANFRAFLQGDHTGAAVGTVGIGNVPATGSSQQTSWFVPPSFPLPYHTSGAYLTGLNANAVITVNLRSIWEYAPNVNDPSGATLVYLSSPSAPYDPVAIELYNSALNVLPVGVPVAENASGDFWDWCLGAISTVAPIVGNIFPGIGTLIGGGIGAAAKSAQLARNRPESTAMAYSAPKNINESGPKPPVKEFSSMGVRPTVPPKPASLRMSAPVPAKRLTIEQKLILLSKKQRKVYNYNVKLGMNPQKAYEIAFQAV